VLGCGSDGGSTMRALLFFFVFVAVAGVGLSRDINKASTPPSAAEPSAAAGMPAVAAAAASASRTVVLQSDGRGHFRVDARIDGRVIDAVVDTGASLVVLNESSAARLGIFPRASDYVGRSQTANGVGRYAPVRLNRIEVNGITVRDVPAAVMPDDALAVNLLGMSFLSRVKWTHNRGRLVLEQ
jgi:aspartyl protease family protein